MISGRLWAHRWSAWAAVSMLLQASPALAQTTRPVVFVLPLTGSLGHGHRQQIASTVENARSVGAAAVVLDINLSGGRIDAAQLALDPILDSSIPVYAFVNPTAWMAGALIALAADSIFMGPQASLGGGTGAREEAEPSAFALRQLRSEFRILAVRRGLDRRVTDAMVDPQVAFENLVEAGERLTLSSDAAVRLGVAAGEVRDIEELLKTVGLEGAEIVMGSPVQTAAHATIRISNQNWGDVRIFLLHGGGGRMRSRLGTVTSMNSAEFSIPEQFVMAGTVIQVVAEVIGSSERVATEQVTMQPGLVVDWVIANVISQSNYFIFIRL